MRSQAQVMRGGAHSSCACAARRRRSATTVAPPSNATTTTAPRTKGSGEPADGCLATVADAFTIFGLDRPPPRDLPDAPLTVFALLPGEAVVLVVALGAIVEVVVVEPPFGEVSGRFPEPAGPAGPPEFVELKPEGAEATGDEPWPPPEPPELVGEVAGALVVVVGLLPTGAALVART
jgi:hypothetical protein